MRDWILTTLVAIIAAVAVLTSSAIMNADTVRVPKSAGVPADLPYWACSEIVDARETEAYEDAKAYNRTYRYFSHTPRVIHEVIRPEWTGDVCGPDPDPLNLEVSR